MPQKKNTKSWKPSSVIGSWQMTKYEFCKQRRLVKRAKSCTNSTRELPVVVAGPENRKTSSRKMTIEVLHIAIKVLQVAMSC